MFGSMGTCECWLLRVWGGDRGRKSGVGYGVWVCQANVCVGVWGGWSLTHTYIPTNKHSHTHSLSHTNIHTYSHSNIHTYSHTHTHTHILKYTHLHTHIYLITYTYILTYQIHSDKIHIHTLPLPQILLNYNRYI